MKTCTGTEKLTRGWWVNQTDIPLRDNLRSYIVDPGTVFWTDGIKVLAAPPGRELVGFVVRRVGGTSPPGWYVHAYGTYHGRYVFNTYDEAKKALDLSCWPVGDYRILPVTRRKREATPERTPAASQAPISLSDALDDQMRGCLRIPRPSACPSFFSENDHKAFQRMWHGNDSVCLSDLMDKKP